MDRLLQITEAALADAYTRAGVGSGRVPGEWMACHPGCHQCCIGVFPISTLDAARLREALNTAAAPLADRIRTRAAASRARLRENFPGNFETGQLFTELHHEEAFDDFANDEICPVLDPATGTCDLYDARPIPCRTFGPPMPNDTEDDNATGLAVCELCFVNAPASEVARCTVDASFLAIEAAAITEHEVAHNERGPTLIAFALR